MPRIRVDPEELREIARQVAQASTHLGELHNGLSRNWSRLDASGWYGAHRVHVEGRWSQARSQTGSVAEQLSALSQRLAESAAILEEADRASLQDIARLDSLVERFRNAVAQSLQVLGAFAVAGRAALEKVLRLGGIIDDIIRRILPVFPPALRLPILRPPVIIWPPKIRIPDWLLPLLPRPKPPEPEPEPKPPEPKPKPTKPKLEPANPKDSDSKTGCVDYARKRRPDLGSPGEGAGGYIDKHKDKVVEDWEDKMEEGYAIVWPPGHEWLKGTAGYTYGHVAIVEEVGPDYVIISHAGVGTNEGPTEYPEWSMHMRIPLDILKGVTVIGT